MEIEGVALRVALLRETPDKLAQFEKIMAQTERRVLRIALRLLNNQHDAQDAAQEVFLRLYKQIGRLDEARGYEAWLFRVTVNVCHDIARKRPQAVALEDAPEPSEHQPDLEFAERRAIMRRALGKLGEKERTAVVLRDVEGLSTREVAEILGSSETTVRSQISMARLKLRDFTSRFLRRRS